MQDIECRRAEQAEMLKKLLLETSLLECIDEVENRARGDAWEA